ncbi:CC-NBS-LRR resistance protein [Medicago truncatula]|uniref:CC-NBS-LRR resistance protein n=1 Tax=Medicago truncatula TaxID=3880 RepID=A0A072VS12_MEDTR|nr:CC-NBS-LRR resistance protein [Medicago truncatula]
MDAIEALQNLEILRLWNSSMIKLPREIEKLTQLRMLDLSRSGIEVVPPNIISSLTKLEELYMGNTSINWKDVSSTVHNENASLADLRKLPKLTALELQIRETSKTIQIDLQLVFEKLERYKIAIGDVWDWSDIEDGTLKTLMLKLGTNIPLEHGIKTLIKGVENLYLDDVNGIQNVLYQLNGEGFPFLKHLHVQNNANLKHIVDSKERNRIHVSFPIWETLKLLNLKNLEHICHGQYDKHSVLKQQPLFIAEEVIPNLEFLRMEQADADMLLQTQNTNALFCKMTCIGFNCYDTDDASFSYWFLENVHTLETLVVEWSCFKKIFQDKGEITEKTHPHIKRLILIELPELQHICEEGSQIDPILEFLECLEVLSCSSLTNLMPSSVTLNHLTMLEVIRCNGLKYLITTPTARSLDKLTVLMIKDCNSLEEVVNGVENVDIAFISLQILMLECLPSLIKFCSSECFMKFPLLKKVIVGECPRMKIFFCQRHKHTNSWKS